MKTRLCLECPNGIAHKIVIVACNTSGFYVAAPYHEARAGYFMKIPIQDGVRRQFHSGPDNTYVASSRAKLSFHPPNANSPDSFVVQFSGHGIRSGFDPETGEPKGLSLKGPPMPEITSGPTFGLCVWGLPDFDRPKPRDKGILCLRRPEMLESINGTKASDAYRVEFFLYRNAARCGEQISPTFFRRYVFEGRECGFKMRVIELPELDSFLGVICLHQDVHFPSASGFTMQSPRLYGWILAAVYPQPSPAGTEVSLDYPPQPTK